MKQWYEIIFYNKYREKIKQFKYKTFDKKIYDKKIEIAKKNKDVARIALYNCVVENNINIKRCCNTITFRNYNTYTKDYTIEFFGR